MKLVLAILLLTLAGPTFAQDLPLMSVKERLRILLWTEGLNETNLPKKGQIQQQKRLPDEIERPLRKM